LPRELRTLDNIDIAVLQKGDESRGVQIPETDVADGLGGVSSGPNPSKGKGKATAPICSDDEVSLDDDEPLQRRRRLLCYDGVPVNGPPPTGQQVPVAITMSWPDPSMAASPVTAPGRSGIAHDAAAVLRAAAEKEAMDAVAAKKATDDMTAAERATADKKVADVVAAKKAADDTAAVERATVGVATRRVLLYRAAPLLLSSDCSMAPGRPGMLRDSVVVLPLSVCVCCFTGILHCAVRLLPVGHAPLGGPALRELPGQTSPEMAVGVVAPKIHRLRWCAATGLRPRHDC
jgi:hypothetical protein